MKIFSGQKRITGILTLLCILLLSMTAMAAETTGSTQTADDIQSVSVDSSKQIIKLSSSNPATPSNAQSSQEEIGPGIKKKAEPEQPKPEGPVVEKGQSLGLFSVTAYCPRYKSSGQQTLTYSGTLPQPNHTVSADISILPLGTKIMIDGIVYTVEDIGGGVKGNTLDIFFSSYQEAMNYGRQTKEVFAVIVS